MGGGYIEVCCDIYNIFFTFWCVAFHIGTEERFIQQFIIWWISCSFNILQANCILHLLAPLSYTGETDPIYATDANHIAINVLSAVKRCKNMVVNIFSSKVISFQKNRKMYNLSTDIHKLTVINCVKYVWHTFVPLPKVLTSEKED